MTDKELLELAAKAAGYEIDGTASKYICQGVVFDDLLMRNEKGGHSVWNPLRDDGDALRLAVNLGLEIVRSRITDKGLPVVSCHRLYDDVHEEAVWQWEFINSDPYTATRRAIVLAAADIGKSR